MARTLKTTLALDKLNGLFNAVDAALSHHVGAKDTLRDARQFLYGPLGADAELEDGDRDALIEIAQRGVRVHSALLEALGAGADGEVDHRKDFASRDEAEKDDPRGLQSPGSGASTSSDSAMAHDAGALADVEAIFQPLPVADDGAPEAAANDAGASPWG